MSEKATKTPQIRFDGYTDAWEQRKASELFKSISDKKHPNLPVLSASQEKGMILRDDIGIDIKYDHKSLSNYKRVTPGQFVIHLRSFQGGFAVSQMEGITSPAYTIIDFKEKDQNHSLFWKEILTSQSFIKRLETVTYGIRDGRSISFSDFSTLKFLVPKLDEQEKIAVLFKTLDQTITLHQRKCDLLAKMKKSYLQKMFPKNGEDKPEIRFDGYTDAWEQRKLGDISKVIDPHPSHRAPAATEKGIPFIGISDVDEVGNINHKTARIVDEKIFDEHHNRYDLSIPSIGIGRVASLGKVIRLRNDLGKYAVSPTMSVIQFTDNNDLNFLYSNMNTPIFQKQFKSFSNGSTRQSVGIQDLRTLMVSLPIDIEEQKQIGSFFYELDTLITLHQRELDSLKKMKKSLLQMMFV